MPSTPGATLPFVGPPAVGVLVSMGLVGGRPSRPSLGHGLPGTVAFAYAAAPPPSSGRAVVATAA